MQLYKKLFLSLLFLLVVAPIFADDIKLTVTGFGDNKANAILDAQRNALRYSYGEFISSDITVLNNELKKDEIVNLVSGTIKNFKVLSSTDVFYANEKFIEVLLEVETSQEDLIAFSKSIGVDASISGSLFGAQVKLQKINAKNESVAIEHLLKLVKSIDDVFDYKLKVFDPKIYKNSNWMFNGKNYYSRYGDDRSQLDANRGAEDKYSITIYTPLILNDNYIVLREAIINTLQSIRMSGKEQTEYSKYEKPYYSIDILIDREGDCAYEFIEIDYTKETKVLSVRNDMRCFNLDFFTKQELRRLSYDNMFRSWSRSTNRIWLRSEKSIKLLGEINSVMDRHIRKYQLKRISGSKENLVNKPAFGSGLYVNHYGGLTERSPTKGKIKTFFSNPDYYPNTLEGWHYNPYVKTSPFVSIFKESDWNTGSRGAPQINYRLRNSKADTGTGYCNGYYPTWDNRYFTYCDMPRKNKIRFYEKEHPFAYLFWTDVVTESELSKITKYSIDIN